MAVVPLLRVVVLLVYCAGRRGDRVGAQRGVRICMGRWMVAQD